jgi:outer membrane lipoprotein
LRLLHAVALFTALCTTLPSCAVNPKFDVAGIDPSLTPHVASEQAATALGTRILWAGVIVNSVNLAQATQLEVLSYPLNKQQKPEVTEPPTGRFLIYQSGYLETGEYRKDRWVTVIGKIERSTSGRVGDFSYTYPVVTPEDIFLWPEGGGDNKVHFGIGVGIGITR